MTGVAPTGKLAAIHERNRGYLSTLEAIGRDWGPLAVGPEGSERPPFCAPEADLPAADWTARIVSAVETLVETRALGRRFSLLEIGGPGVSAAAALADAFPGSFPYAVCVGRASCAVHRPAAEAGVGVYDVDPRQVFGAPVTRKRGRGFDVVVCLLPEVLSPARRPEGGDRFLPELARHWLDANARWSFLAVDRRRDVGWPGRGETRRLAGRSRGVALVCRAAESGTSPPGRRRWAERTLARGLFPAR